MGFLVFIWWYFQFNQSIHITLSGHCPGNSHWLVMVQGLFHI